MTSNENGEPLAGKTIVSLTPQPSVRDSRTLRLARAFSASGAKSIIVELLQSGSAGGGPVPTISLFRSRGRNGGGVARPIGGLAHLVKFCVLYFVVVPLVALFRVPRADIYYLHEYRLFPAAVLLRAVRGGVIAYDAHDYYPEVVDNRGMSGIWRQGFLPLIVWMDKAAVRSAVVFVTVSVGVAELYRCLTGRTAQVVRNLHDPSLDQKVSETLRQRLSLRDEDVIVVAAGNYGAGLRIEELIAAVGRLPERFHLALIGAGYEEFDAVCDKAGLHGRVHLLGSVTAAEMMPLMAGADMSAIMYYPLTPDYEYSLPNKFFQSIAAGLPIVYGGLTEMKKIVDEYGFGICVDTADPADIARGISDVAARINELAGSAKRAHAALNWQDEAEGLTVILGRKLINGDGL